MLLGCLQLSLVIEGERSGHKEVRNVCRRLAQQENIPGKAMSASEPDGIQEDVHRTD